MLVLKEENEALIEYFRTKDIRGYGDYPSQFRDFEDITVFSYKIDRTGAGLKVEFSGKSKNGDWNEYAKIRIPLVDFMLFCSQFNK